MPLLRLPVVVIAVLVTVTLPSPRTNMPSELLPVVPIVPLWMTVLPSSARETIPRGSRRRS